jgi:hypothetical protein
MQVTIPRRFQGIEGMAQGGHVAGLVSSLLDHEVAISFRSPCPLEVPLVVQEDGEHHRLLHGDLVVLDAEPDDFVPEPLPFVSWAEAEAARAWAETQSWLQNVSTCFSCGSGPESLRVHAGRVNQSGIYASPFVHPPWMANGRYVEHRFLWAPIDCAAGWRVAVGEDARPAVTGRSRVAVHHDVEAGEPLVVVADAEAAWDGRKRRARSAIFAADGTPVATSESLWIAIG